MDSLLDAERLADCARNDVANEPQQRQFSVLIKCGPAVIHEFTAFGTDSMTVAAQHECLCELGQYIRVLPFGRKEEPFPLAVARNHVAQLELREAITEGDRIAADLAEDRNKAARRFAISYGQAVDDQIQFQGCIGELPR